jgi:hypothetical protein
VILRALVLHPVVLGGIFLLLAPLVAWRVRRRTGSMDRAPRLVAAALAVTLLAGVLAAVSGRWGTPLGDAFRLRALERTEIAGASPPGVRLIGEGRHVSSYIGLDEYTADEKDPPDRSSYQRAYRVEADLAGVLDGFDRLATRTGWKLVAASCGPAYPVEPAGRYRVSRGYERRLPGFRATLGITSYTVASTVFPGTSISDVEVRLTAPSVLAGEPAPAGTIDRACLAPPPPAPRPPAPQGACPAADRKLGSSVPEAAMPLADRPLRASSRPADLRRLQVTAADEAIVASDPPSEPRPLLEKHGAIDGYDAYDLASGKGRRPGHREKTFAYQFPSHEAAVAFHGDVVARACPQAMEAFDVPGVPDAIGLRLYVPATGPECRERWDLQWGLAFGSSYPPGCGDWLIEYIAFVRGQYHVSVAVGVKEWEAISPWAPPDLAAVHEAALKVGAAAGRRACEVRAGAGPTCR